MFIITITALISGNGVEINNVLRFFVGDHKAIAFEQGTQCGGNFPCGTCGIYVSKFTDQTQALRRRVRSLQDIQNLATSGCFGKIFNVVRPFENLTMGEIQTKLRLRGCIDVDINMFLPLCLAVQLVNSNNSTYKDIRFCLVSHYMT